MAYCLYASLFGRSRFCAGPTALDNCLDSTNEKEGKIRYCFCYESRRVVSLGSARQSFPVQLTPHLSSAGAAAIVKTTYLVALSAKADFTCKTSIGSSWGKTNRLSHIRGAGSIALLGSGRRWTCYNRGRYIHIEAAAC